MPLKALTGSSAKSQNQRLSSRTITQNYNTTYTLPDLAFRDGYTFVGWFDSSNNQITSWDFSKDITVYAIWEKND